MHHVEPQHNTRKAVSAEMPREHTQATQNAHRATHSVFVPCQTSFSRHREQAQNEAKGPGAWQNLTILADTKSAARASRASRTPKQRSTSAARGQSQSLHDCASFVSSTKNTNRMTSRSSHHARSPSMSTRAEQKRTFRRRLNVRFIAPEPKSVIEPKLIN